MSRQFFDDDEPHPKPFPSGTITPRRQESGTTVEPNEDSVILIEEFPRSPYHRHPRRIKSKAASESTLSFNVDLSDRYIEPIFL